MSYIEQSLFNRYFELKVAQKNKEGVVPNPIYLSVGTEHIPAILEHSLSSNKIDDYAVFAQHRCHSTYLSFGGCPKRLVQQLINGREGSASLSIKDKMFGHSGLLGDQCGIATGYAHATQKMTICILGDAACEEGYVLESLGYAATHKLPILFVCEDNNLSILTEKKVRRSWSIVDVAKGFGIDSHQVDDDFISLESIFHYCIANITYRSRPYLININCNRHLWHAGCGIDGSPKWDRLSKFLPTMPDRIIKEIEELWI